MNVFGSHASLIVHLLSFSRSDPVLFPYQSRFNSDLSPFFLSLALGKEGMAIWELLGCLQFPPGLVYGCFGLPPHLLRISFGATRTSSGEAPEDGRRMHRGTGGRKAVGWRSMMQEGRWGESHGERGGTGNRPRRSGGVFIPG